MTRFLLGVAFIAITTANVAAQAPAGSLNDWVEACQAVDPDLQALLANEAMIVPTESITWNPEDGTFNLTREPLVRLFDLPELELCDQSRFYKQPRVLDSPTRSAVQVGPDLVLTSWHDVFDPAAVVDFFVVFGLQYRKVGSRCLEAAFEHIPTSHLFAITEVLADGQVLFPGQPFDAVLMRLDRVAGTSYPRVRRSGQGRPGDALTGITHPERMAAKVDLAASAGPMELGPYGRERLQSANLHRLNGSSGGMIYNRTQRILESVVEFGLGAATYTHPPNQACWVVAHQNGYSTAGPSLRYFAGYIPAFELLVRSLDPVVHVGTVGGGITNASTARSVTAPGTAAGPLSYEIVPPPPFTPGEPTLIITPGGPLTGTLSPGQGFTIQQQAHIHGVGCGTYKRSYRVRDLTNGFEDVALHTFEIGLSEFTVSARHERTIQDRADPFAATDLYTLDNPRPDAVTVVVTADQDWVTLNGVAGHRGARPTITLLLPPQSKGHEVRIGVGDSIRRMAHGRYQATVHFAFDQGAECPAFDRPVARTFDFVH